MYKRMGKSLLSESESRHILCSLSLQVADLHFVALNGGHLTESAFETQVQWLSENVFQYLMKENHSSSMMECSIC
jgi:hypothetical protein